MNGNVFNSLNRSVLWSDSHHTPPLNVRTPYILPRLDRHIDMVRLAEPSWGCTESAIQTVQNLIMSLHLLCRLGWAVAQSMGNREMYNA